MDSENSHRIAKKSLDSARCGKSPTFDYPYSAIQKNSSILAAHLQRTLHRAVHHLPRFFYQLVELLPEQLALRRVIVLVRGHKRELHFDIREDFGEATFERGHLCMESRVQLLLELIGKGTEGSCWRTHFGLKKLATTPVKSPP